VNELEATTDSFEPGLHRVHLKEAGGQSWITVLVPLNRHGEVDFENPRPWLFKSRWDGDEHFGEVLGMTEKSGRLLTELYWATSDPDRSVTDFLTVPVRRLATVRFWEEDVADDRFNEFKILNVQRV
jgi:hypothetical protein